MGCGNRERPVTDVLIPSCCEVVVAGWLIRYRWSTTNGKSLTAGAGSSKARRCALPATQSTLSQHWKQMRKDCVKVGILCLTYVNVKLSITNLYSAEAWRSISTALCVLSGNIEISSPSTVVWNGCCWAPGHGDCYTEKNNGGLSNFCTTVELHNKTATLIPYRYDRQRTSAVRCLPASRRRRHDKGTL